MRPAVKRAADATKSALSELKPGDRLAVMVFDCQTDLIADFTGDFGAADQAIREHVLVREFKTRPRSALGVVGFSDPCATRPGIFGNSPAVNAAGLSSSSLMTEAPQPSPWLHAIWSAISGPPMWWCSA